jgi:hypothetical protein
MNRHFIPNIIKFCKLLIILYLSTSCNKDSFQYIPDVQIDYELDVNIDLANLGIGQMATITAYSVNNNLSVVDFLNPKIPKIYISYKTYGNGIILYKRDFDQYEVFDRTCPYRGLIDKCGVNVNKADLTAVCPCCNSVFSIYSEGMPGNGSLAQKPLYQYQAVLVSYDSRLIISK